MRDREYDIAFLEVKMRNDELEREWLLHKLGRRAEVLLNAQENQQNSPQAGGFPQASTNTEASTYASPGT